MDIVNGKAVLESYIKTAPSQAGVYRMIAKDGLVLYVGKAKNIKKRIFSYTQINKLPLRLQMMVAQIDKMEFIVTDNEHKALLLENELIKKLEPKYNILLKDDKTFPHLMIDFREDYPVLKKHRGAQKEGIKYFGPFANVGALNNVIDILQKTFLLRTCKDVVFKNRKTPCLLHQIKRCSAPCIGLVSKVEYAQNLKMALEFLEGKNDLIQTKLSLKMQEASSKKEFEQAIIYRNQIEALTNIQSHNKLEYQNIKSADIVGVYKENNLFCIEVFFIRSNTNCGNAIYFPKIVLDTSEAEVLEAFLSDFYATNIPPLEIVISHDFENKEFLSDALGTKISVPKLGNKAKLVQGVLENAKLGLRQKIAHNTSIKNNLLEMQKVFDLPQMPQRIEVYDNSHIQGSYAIGAFVVAGPNGFEKKHYRKFDIKNPNANGDDLVMMKEVLARRFAKMSPENRPDIILLDGGRNQLNAVLEALKDFNLDEISIIAISKGEKRNAGLEEYHQPNRPSFALKFASSLAFYMQNLRDEAHRFAIGTHRKKRSKSLVVSELDDVLGIGAQKKKALLNYFGSIKAVVDAGVDDICKVKGFNKKTAEKVYLHFHN